MSLSLGEAGIIVVMPQHSASSTPQYQRAHSKQLNDMCGERTFTTPKRRLKLMTNSMMINRKLVVTSAESDNINFTLLKAGA